MNEPAKMYFYCTGLPYRIDSKSEIERYICNQNQTKSKSNESNICKNSEIIKLILFIQKKINVYRLVANDPG